MLTTQDRRSFIKDVVTSHPDFQALNPEGKTDYVRQILDGQHDDGIQSYQVAANPEVASDMGDSVSAFLHPAFGVLTPPAYGSAQVSTPKPSKDAVNPPTKTPQVTTLDMNLGAVQKRLGNPNYTGDFVKPAQDMDAVPRQNDLEATPQTPTTQSPQVITEKDAQGRTTRVSPITTQEYVKAPPQPLRQDEFGPPAPDQGVMPPDQGLVGAFAQGIKGSHMGQIMGALNKTAGIHGPFENSAQYPNYVPQGLGEQAAAMVGQGVMDAPLYVATGRLLGPAFEGVAPGALKGVAEAMTTAFPAGVLGENAEAYNETGKPAPDLGLGAGAREAGIGGLLGTVAGGLHGAYGAAKALPDAIDPYGFARQLNKFKPDATTVPGANFYSGVPVARPAESAIYTSTPAKPTVRDTSFLSRVGGVVSPATIQDLNHAQYKVGKGGNSALDPLEQEKGVIAQNDWDALSPKNQAEIAYLQKFYRDPANQDHPHLDDAIDILQKLQRDHRPNSSQIPFNEFPRAKENGQSEMDFIGHTLRDIPEEHQGGILDNLLNEHQDFLQGGDNAPPEGYDDQPYAGRHYVPPHDEVSQKEGLASQGASIHYTPRPRTAGMGEVIPKVGDANDVRYEMARELHQAIDEAVVLDRHNLDENHPSVIAANDKIAKLYHRIDAFDDNRWFQPTGENIPDNPEMPPTGEKTIPQQPGGSDAPYRVEGNEPGNSAARYDFTAGSAREGQGPEPTSESLGAHWKGVEEHATTFKATLPGASDEYLVKTAEQADKMLPNNKVGQESSAVLRLRDMLRWTQDELAKRQRNWNSTMTPSDFINKYRGYAQPEVQGDIEAMRNESHEIDLASRDLSSEWTSAQARGELTPERMKDMRDRLNDLGKRKQDVIRRIEEWRKNNPPPDDEPPYGGFATHYVPPHEDGEVSVHEVPHENAHYVHPGEGITDMTNPERGAVNLGGGEPPHPGFLGKVGDALNRAAMIRKAAMLTSPKTAGKIAGANLGFATLEELARVPGALNDMALSKLTGRRSLAGPDLGGIKDALGEAKNVGIPEAKEILRSGRPQPNPQLNLFTGKPAPYPGEARHAGFDSQEVKGNFPSLDAVVNSAFRVHGSIDRVFNRYAFRRSLEDQIKVGKLNGIQGDLITPAMIHKAEEEARFQTFNNDNPVSDWVRHANDPAMRTALDFLVPFSRKPTNAAFRALDYGVIGGLFRGARTLRNKGLNETMRALKGSMTQDEQRYLAQALGRGETGLFVLGLGGILYKAGILTGTYHHGDRDTNEAMGRADGSIKVGGAWHDIRQFDPASNLLIMGASTARNGADVGATLKDSLKVLSDTPLSRGASDVTKLLSEPDKAQRLIGSFAGSFVPAGVADIADATDPEHAKRSVTDVGSSILNRIPGLRENLPVEHDPFGDKIESNPMNLVDSTRPVTDKTDTDKTLNQLFKANEVLNKPSHNIKFAGATFKLPEGLYQEYLETSGRQAKDILSSIVADGSWGQIPPESRKQILRKTFDYARKYAAGMMADKLMPLAESARSRKSDAVTRQKGGQ